MSPPSRAWPPWWLMVAAAAFAIYFALLVAADLRRPESLGLTLAVDGAGMRVAQVTAGSPADEAGLRAGDRIVSANGRRIRVRSDWLAFYAHLTVPGAATLEVTRGTGTVRTGLQWKRIDASFWFTLAGATLAIARVSQLATLFLAIVVVWRRPLDQTARIGAWLLASIALFSFMLPYGFAVIWRALPDPVEWLLVLPHASSLAVGPIMLTFFARFPRPRLGSALSYLALWIPALPLLVVQLDTSRAIAYQTTALPVPDDFVSLLALTPALYAIAAVAGVWVAYRQEMDVTARRRIRIVASGSVIGLMGIAPIVITQTDVLNSSVLESPLIAAGTLIGLACPASFVYAILRHRLFDVSFIVRRSLQYALARRVLLSIVPLAAATFLIDLLMNRHVPVGAILQERGWLYASVAGLAVVARTRRQVWLDALDRKFFRERYNAQRLLRDIAEHLERAPTVVAGGSQAVGRIETALHPTVTALMVRNVGSRSYECVAAAPADVAVAPLAANSTIAALLPVLQRPLRFSTRHDDTFISQLTPAELDWVRRHGIELLVPVQAGAHEAFLALGARRSEEPYSAEDEDLLATVGHAVALILLRELADSFEECPTCGDCYVPGTTTCAVDGSALMRQRFPQVLEDRYCLRRRIGHGGMGRVYAADDNGLHRRVAVKVLGQDLQDPAAAERFRIEAQSAAALAHPNVVTVFDIGVSRSGCAFFVMELLDGVPLDQELRRVGRLPPDRALRLFQGICGAVRTAHARRLVHRDLKPQNIFLCLGEGGERPKVLDFGLAKALEATRTLTLQGVVLGTLRYMSPEQLRGENTSVDGDLWALALIALEMLAGSEALDRPPGITPRLDHLPLSPSLRQAFARALAPDPLDRPASVDELLDSLERANALGDGPASRDIDTVPGRGYRFVAPARDIGEENDPRRSLAVLPLANLSGDRTRDFFAEGITDELIGCLMKTTALRVASRTSVMVYKDVSRPMREIARELDVQWVVEGTVKQVDGRVRITVHLIDGTNESQLWASEYERDMRDILALQSDVASEIARRVRVTVSAPMASPPRPIDPDSYDAYLRGRYFLNRRTREDLRRAVDYFRKAIDRDPTYASAHAGLADAYALLGTIGYDVLPPREAMPRARAAAIQALEIDGTMAQAHACLGYVKLSYEWDWPGAERQFKEALACNPAYATAHLWYGHCLFAMHRLDEAAREMDRALESDPLSVPCNLGVGWSLYYARLYDEAIAHYHRTAELAPRIPMVHYELGLSYWNKGCPDEALAAFEKGHELSGGEAASLMLLAHSYAQVGRSDEAHRHLATLEAMAKHEYVPAIYMAFVHAGYGDKDQTFAWFERAYQERSNYLIYLGVEPSLDMLRTDRRYAALLNSVGLPVPG